MNDILNDNSAALFKSSNSIFCCIPFYARIELSYVNYWNNYVEKFDKMTKQQKEAWYDGIFQQGLMLFLTIEQAKRTKEIAGFKASLNEK